MVTSPLSDKCERPYREAIKAELLSIMGSVAYKREKPNDLLAGDVTGRRGKLVGVPARVVAAVPCRP